MAPRKLSDSDKHDIVDLYRQPGQTSSTLAEQFGVSNSTISRILKTALPSDEYSELIAQKRMSSGTATKPETTRKRRTSRQSTDSQANSQSSVIEAEPSADAADGDSDAVVEPPKLKQKPDESSKEPAAKTSRRRRKKSNDDGQLPLLEQEPEIESDEAAQQAVDAPVADSSPAPKRVLAPILASSRDDEDDDEDEDDDDLEGLDDTLGDDFGDDDDLDEDDEDDEDDEFEAPKPKLQLEESVEIMPLDAAVMPKPCYLVIDMRAELITRPLSEFGELGRIPSDEEKSNTLPVFDNHRVARRFSRNKQRVIKVPDGSLITRTSPYLQAKGITRLLVDGQVFDLAGTD
jgi:transposase-like protein